MEQERRESGLGAVGLAVAGILLLVFALNLALPRSYLIFGFDHLSYLPRGFRFAWTALCLALLGAATRARADSPVLSRLFVPAVALALASLAVFRTTLPGIHGDGEGGGSPYGAAADLAKFPDVDGRVQSFLCQGLRSVVPGGLRFAYRFSGLFQDYPKNSAWILLTLLCGALTMLVLAAAARRLGRPAAARLGVLILALTAPPMVNAFGHFDSYIVPVLCLTLWFLLVFRIRAEPAAFDGWAALPFVLLLAYGAHPILALLAGYSALLAVFAALDRWKVRMTGPGAAALGLAAGILPYAIGRGNLDFFGPAGRGIAGWLVHEKAMSCLLTGLPALALAGIVLAQDRGALRFPRPGQSLGIVLCVATCVQFFSLWFGYAIRDEFLYSLLGAILLGGAVLLFVESRVDPRAVLLVGLLSLYLWVPKAWVYSGPLLYERFSTVLLRDPSQAVRAYSAYYVIAGFTPVDTPDFRARKLAILREGFERPLRMWDEPRYRVTNRAHYTAWCLEWGLEEEALGQLAWFVEHEPQVLPELWRGDGRAFRTDQFLNRAPAAARRLLESIAPESLKPALAAAARGDPVADCEPLPGTTEADLKPRLGEFWDACADARRRWVLEERP